MTLDVTLWVLAGAVCHATWNALVKTSPGRFFDISAMNAAAALFAAAALPFLPPADPACVPWLVTSAVLQMIYFTGVAMTYRSGNLSQSYAVMRGIAPVLVAVAGAVLLDDVLSPGMWTGVVLIGLGLTVPALIATRGIAMPGSATVAALATAVIIASYTLVDGMGARASGSPATYGAWLFVLHGLPIAAWGYWRGRGELVRHVVRHWWRGMACGMLMTGSYLIALWAMTRAPIAAVAALRETSIVFAAVIGAVLLKESFGGWRVAGAALVAAGVAALRL